MGGQAARPAPARRGPPPSAQPEEIRLVPAPDATSPCQDHDPRALRPGDRGRCARHARHARDVAGDHHAAGSSVHPPVVPVARPAHTRVTAAPSRHREGVAFFGPGGAFSQRGAAVSGTPHSPRSLSPMGEGSIQGGQVVPARAGRRPREGHRLPPRPRNPPCPITGRDFPMPRSRPSRFAASRLQPPWQGHLRR